MAGLISPPLFGEGESVLRRIKMLLAVTTIMATLLAMNAGPALADDDGCIGPRGDNGKCIGVETDRGHHDFDRHDFDNHDFFLNDFDRHDFDNHDFFLNDFDGFEDFAELDDCEFVRWDGDEAVFVCEVDFD